MKLIQRVGWQISLLLMGLFSLNSFADLSSDYSFQTRPVVLPNLGVLVSNDFGMVRLPGMRMSVPGQIISGVVATDDSSLTLNLLDSTENDRVISYIKHVGDSSRDINLEYTQPDKAKQVMSRGLQYQGAFTVPFGAETGKVIEYGLLDGEPRVWQCQDGQACTTVNIETGSYVTKNPPDEVFQYEQVIAMAKDGSYLITLYNQQSAGSSEANNASKYLEQEDDELVVEASPSPSPSPSPAACTGISCIIIAKAVRKDDGSYGAPVPLWQDPDVTCGLPAVHLDTSAQTMVVYNDCAATTMYAFTGLQNSKPAVTKIDNSTDYLWPVGVSTSGKVALVYAKTTKGLEQEQIRPGNNLLALIYDEKITGKLGSTGIHYSSQLNTFMLKRSISNFDSDPTQLQNSSTEVCLVEYDLTDTFVKPSSCLKLVTDAISPGDILKVTYLSGHDIAVVSSDLFEGNGILTGNPGSRTFTALKDISAFKKDVSELDMNGVSSVSGTSDQFTIGFAANWGGNNCCDDAVPTPTAGLMIFTSNRNSVTPWYKTQTAFMIYAGLGGTLLVGTPLGFLAGAVTMNIYFKKFRKKT